MIPVITGRRGQLKGLDDYFAGMLVRAIGIELRKCLNARSAAGVAGPTIDRNGPPRLLFIDRQGRSVCLRARRRIEGVSTEREPTPEADEERGLGRGGA